MPQFPEFNNLDRSANLNSILKYSPRDEKKDACPRFMGKRL